MMPAIFIVKMVLEENSHEFENYTSANSQVCFEWFESKLKVSFHIFTASKSISSVGRAR